MDVHRRFVHINFTSGIQEIPITSLLDIEALTGTVQYTAGACATHKFTFWTDHARVRHEAQNEASSALNQPSSNARMPRTDVVTPEDASTWVKCYSI